ncbi:MAG TPA: plastocyanin/azurin family copper-binding protein [bacterium]|jgi:plastocyanin
MRVIRRIAAVPAAVALLFAMPALAQAPTAVIVQNFSFQPPEITVSVGGAVQWTNRDGTRHQIESDDGKVAGPAMATQESFSFTFQTAGRVTYHCAIHPSMTGLVVVQ